MSASSAPIADELCLLARNPYDAGQRALWHLDKIGSVIDCSVMRSNALGPDMELIYAVPQPQKRGMNPRVFPHSASLEEFGFAGDALSPRSPTPVVMSPSSIGSGVSGDTAGSSSRFVRISAKTKLNFVNPVSVAVISLDLSPSMNVVDTSFKSVTTGCHLVDNLVRSLELALRCLAKSPVANFSDSSVELPFVPSLVVTVVAHGVPDLQVFPLAVGEVVTEALIPAIVASVNKRLKTAIDQLAAWLRPHHAMEQLAGARSCSRTRNPCTSLVCQANDITVIVRDCLTAISMTCAQLSLSKAGVHKSIMIITDGVLAHPRKLHYDNILMHLNFVDVALHILQIGGGFAPWSAMGYVSDPDLLRLLAASTPTGLFLQDHHIDPILAGSLQSGPHIAANVLWKAWVLKCSPLTSAGGRGGKRSHMPYKALTYQSSVLVRRQGTTTSPKMGPAPAIQSYIDHIEASSISRREHTIRLQGIEESKPFELLPPSSATASPIVRKRDSSVDSMPSMDSIDTDSDDEEFSHNTEGVQTLKQYLQPEKAKARPYLYKQYKLPGVSAAQIIQIRAREGFLIDAVNTSVSNSSRSALPRVGSIGGSLGRTNSSVSLQGLSPNGPGPTDPQKRSVTMSMHWGPVMDVMYEITSSSCDAEEDCDSYLSRPSEEMRIKVYLRMPSGEFFLKFKQQLAASTATHASETNFWQMCRQLDAFIDAIFAVDDTLTKLTCPRSARSAAASAKRSVSDPKLAPPLMQRQSSLSLIDHRRSSTSLDKIAEHSSSMSVLPSSMSQESLMSAYSSAPPSPPITPLRQPATEAQPYQPPVEIEASLLKQVLPKDVSTWHRWFTVRSLFVLLDVSSHTVNQRIRHGMTGPMLLSAREELIEEIRQMSHAELEPNTRFYCKISEWNRVKSIIADSHTTNVLSRTNDALIARLVSGDARIGTVTDPVLPFMVLDMAPQTTDSSNGVVKVIVAMFGCCPAAERAAVDHMSHAISAGILVDAPSPIFRAMQAGLLAHAGSATQIKRQASKKQAPVLIPVGMGNGDSFYTYNPDGIALNRFMLHHAWETICPPASVQADVLTSIHERRIKEGWKCINETPTSLVYAQIADGSMRVDPGAQRTVKQLRDIQRIWFPGSSDTPSARSDKIVAGRDVIIDWEMMSKLQRDTGTNFIARNSVRGPCVSLAVQYVQARGEKPSIRCQVWADRSHPDWGDSISQPDFESRCEALCSID